MHNLLADAGRSNLEGGQLSNASEFDVQISSVGDLKNTPLERMTEQAAAYTRLLNGILNTVEMTSQIVQSQPTHECRLKQEASKIRRAPACEIYKILDGLQ